MKEDASTQNLALAGHLLDHYAGRIARTHRPYVLGLSGLQGSGKSTLARVIKTQAEQRGWPTEVLSLDDFYYSRSEREALAHQVHPLLRTRGVPGTHEIGFDALGDTITLRHTARSREGFARGALRAARWVVGKRGFFEFGEIVGELGEEEVDSRKLKVGREENSSGIGAVVQRAG